MIPFRAPRYESGDRLEVAGCPVRLRVDQRARRVSLRLDVARREVVATAPSARKLADAVAFAQERSAWMSGLLAKLPQGRLLEPGQTIDVLGRPCRLERAASRRAAGLTEDADGQVMRAFGDDRLFDRAVVRLLKAEALRVLRERTAAHAAALGAALPEIKLTDAKSRWGSCKPARGLHVACVRYSWRLVLAPWPVMDYVAAHECAHLVEANHSARYWAVLHGLVGDERPHRAWLRAHGASLHAFG